MFLLSHVYVAKDYAEPRPGDADEGATALVESSVVAEENQRLSAFFAEVYIEY